MSIAKLYGGWRAQIGPNPDLMQTLPSVANVTVDAANESAYFIGYIATSDGASHTIDTTGSSALEWRSGTVTFANAGTTVKVGLAAVDTGAGPVGRPVNVADVVTFDVSKTLTGGGGGITTAAWQIHVPDAGTKTIAHGDLVCFCIQATARAGADSILVAGGSTAFQLGSGLQFGGFTSAAYTGAGGIPNAFITFSDGATGFFHGAEVFSTQNTRLYNSGSATVEYGQLFKIPYPVRIYGIYGYVAASADHSVVLYSDPLGTPVAERTVAVDLNTVNTAGGRRFSVLFSSPYDTTADQLVGAVLKPGASNITAYYKTLNSAAHRVADVWGVQGYGISRASGAFADANSGLDHYHIGLLIGGGEVGGGGGGGVSRARTSGGT